MAKLHHERQICSDTQHDLKVTNSLLKLVRPRTPRSAATSQGEQNTLQQNEPRSHPEGKVARALFCYVMKVRCQTVTVTRPFSQIRCKCQRSAFHCDNLHAD